MARLPRTTVRWLVALPALALLAVQCSAASPATDLGLVVTRRGFLFLWGRQVVRTTEIRSTRPDRQCVETTVMRRDSVTSHRRVIWRADRGVRWTLDLEKRTYTEIDLRTDREVSDAFQDLCATPDRTSTNPDTIPAPVGDETRVVGYEARHYRWHMKPDFTADAWVATDVPGAGIRIAFTNALDRAIQRQGGEELGPATKGVSGRSHAGSMVLRQMTLMKDESSPEPAPPSPTDTSLAARVARAWSPRIPASRDSGVADSIGRAWGVSVGSRLGSAEEVMSIREVRIPDPLFEIPAGFRKGDLSQEFMPWDKAARRRPRSGDGAGPGRLNPFAVLDARRDTPLHQSPSPESPARFTAEANDLLDPIELDPVRGFYRVRDVSHGDRPEGWVAATDVEEMSDEGPTNFAGASELARIGQQMNLRIGATAISSIRSDSGRVVVVVRDAWRVLEPEKRRRIALEISTWAAGGRGAATLVVRDSLTGRILGEYRGGRFEER